MIDHKTQIFNEYFEDLTNALCFGIKSEKIKNSELKITDTEIVLDLYSIMVHDINQYAKIEIFLFGEIFNNDPNTASSLGIKCVFYDDKIIISSLDLSGIYEIYTKEDYFNILLERDLVISYESLKFVQSLIPKVNKHLFMCYAKEEEKFYGYM